MSCENKPIFACGSVKNHACKKSSRPPSVLKNLPGHSTLSCFLLHSLSLSPMSSGSTTPFLSSQPSLSLSLTAVVAEERRQQLSLAMVATATEWASPPPLWIYRRLASREVDPAAAVLGEADSVVVGGRRHDDGRSNYPSRVAKTTMMSGGLGAPFLSRADPDAPMRRPGWGWWQRIRATTATL